MNKAENRKILLCLLVILAVGALLLGQRTSDPFDGYLAFNEAWYALIAENYKTHSFLIPTVEPGLVDLNVPPLFSYLLYPLFLIFGSREWAFRLLPIAGSIASILLVFLIGRKLFSARAGLIAAALTAAAPVFVLTGRNVQVDAVYLCLLLAGYLVYLKAGESPARWAAAGILLGLSLFTKQFAGAIFAAIFAIEIRERGGLRGLHRRFALLAACAAAVPAPFYLWHLINNPSMLFESQRYGAAGLAEIPSLRQFLALLNESAFAFGVLFFFLAAAAAAAVVLKRSPQRFRAAAPLAVYAVFFLVFHKHSYYVLTALPFAALAAGAWLDSMKPAARAAILAPVLAVSLIGALLVLGFLKFGYRRFDRICGYVESGRGTHTLIADYNILANYGPAFTYYCRNTKIINTEELKKIKSGGIIPSGQNHGDIFILNATDSPVKFESPYVREFNIERLGFSFFGIGLSYEPARKSSFIPGRIQIDSPGLKKIWGYYPAGARPSLLLTTVPPGHSVFMENQRITIRRKQ